MHPLTVYTPTLPKRRYGRDHDGGYVMVDGLRYDHFISGGIADDNSFERAVLDAQPHLTCDAYDPHSDGGPHKHDRLRFHSAVLPMGLGGVPGNYLVKIDIEGDEWPWLAYQLAEGVEQIAQLVVELHSPHLDRWSWPTLSALAVSHYLVHAHGNNWDGIVEIEGVRMPGTLETTWLRKDIDPGLSPSAEIIPGPLDMPNNRAIPDHVIDWAPFRIA